MVDHLSSLCSNAVSFGTRKVDPLCSVLLHVRVATPIQERLVVVTPIQGKIKCKEKRNDASTVQRPLYNRYQWDH